MVIGDVIITKAIPITFHIVQNSLEGKKIKSENITIVIPQSMVKINGIKYLDVIPVIPRYVPVTYILANQ